MIEFMISLFLIIIFSTIMADMIVVYVWDQDKVSNIRKKYGIIWNPMKIGVIFKDGRSNFLSTLNSGIGAFVVQFFVREKTEEEIEKIKKKYGVDD